jgi:predicted flap endonuclease-1-like 5' DNA nuclease
VRQRLVERTGIGADLILRWVNHVDLTRIHGVGGQYAELLEAAGVDSVPELAHRNPESLYARMAEVNQARRLVRQLPALPQVRKWVSQAASLPRVVMH